MCMAQLNAGGPESRFLTPSISRRNSTQVEEATGRQWESAGPEEKGGDLVIRREGQVAKGGHQPVHSRLGGNQPPSL